MRESEDLRGGGRERSQSHCGETSVCFVESQMYSAHVSSARWTGPFLKTHQCLFLFSSLSQPFARSLDTPLSSPLVHSNSFFYAVVHSLIFSPQNPFDLFLCPCLLYPPSIHSFFVLGTFSLKIETSAGGCSRISSLHVCFKRKEGERRAM